MDNGYNLSDLAAITRNNDDSFGGAWWIIVLFLFMFGANGWGNRNITDTPITEAGLCNAMNFNNLENAVGRLSDQNQNQTATLSNGISTVGYETQNAIAQLGKEVALGQANLSQRIDSGNYALAQQLSNCCCTTQRGLDAINANIDAKFAAIEKTQLEQTIASQQNQINQLNLQAQLCGVVRYPNSTAYTAGYNPFYNPTACNCGTSF